MDDLINERILMFIANDYDIYCDVKGIIADCDTTGILAYNLREYFEEKMVDLDLPLGLFMDLLGVAIANADWIEIAKELKRK